MKVEVKLTQHINGKLVTFESKAEFTHQRWRPDMRTYTIEARVNFDDAEKYDIFLEHMREAARTAMATALMMKDKRDPQVALSMGDMVSREESLDLISPEEALGTRGE